MSSNDDKRELLKLKQGLILESETIKEEKPQIIELHGRKKFENILYHYKTPIIITIFAIFAALYMLNDYFGREKMDLRILMVSTTTEASEIFEFLEDTIEYSFERFCPDFDGNGNTHTEMFFININREDFEEAGLYMGNYTKLFGELQFGIAQMILGNKDAFYTIIEDGEDIGDYFLDLSEIYPDNPQITDKYFFKLQGSNLAGIINWDSAPGDMYIAIRKNNEGNDSREAVEYRIKALELLDNIVNNKLNKIVIGN